VRLIESEIRELKLRILDMADLVRVQLDNTCVALSDLNADMAHRVLKKEKDIDKLDNKINKRCERIIALYQPVANDLRFVFSVLKLNAYLESIGDQVTSIADRVLQIQRPFTESLWAELEMTRLQALTKHILFDALRAYFKENADDAKAIFQRDDAIDEVHKAAFAVIVRTIEQDTSRTSDYIHLLNIVALLEKVGDLSVAVAEEALFHTEGITYRHSELKYAHKTDLKSVVSLGEDVATA
jgi:phosphate transport system protein